MPRLPSFLPFVLVALLTGNACVERATAPTQAGSSIPPPAATTSSPASDPQTKTCPQPNPDKVCAKDYKPVVCDGCAASARRPAAR